MANNLGNYFEDKLLDHMFQLNDGAKAYRPTALYVGLSTAAPGESGSGIAEPSGNAYARVVLANGSATKMGLSSGSTAANSADINFPTATGSWGTVTHVFITDASSGAGNLHWHGPLQTAKTIGNNDAVSFPIGSLTFSLD